MSRILSWLCYLVCDRVLICFFFNDTATTAIYTLSLHDALPISSSRTTGTGCRWPGGAGTGCRDRKSTRLNSSHVSISYAVFCLKKKNYANPCLCHRKDRYRRLDRASLRLAPPLLRLRRELPELA